MDKKFFAFGDTETEKGKFLGHKNPILIDDDDDDDIKKNTVSNRFLSLKRVLNIFLVTKIMKKLS